MGISLRLAKHISFIMSSNTMSIGEPESSQDTPMRNTTPLKRSRVQDGRSGTTTKAKKKQKMNQCQLAFHVILMHDVMVDSFDGSYESIDDELNNMVKKLEDGEASIQTTEKVDDELLQLIQELEERSQAAKDSKEGLGTQVAKLAPISSGEETKPEGILMPDYDEQHDGLIVRGCTRAFNERTELFNSVLENTNKVKQQVETFQGELGQVRAEVSSKVGAIRLEYEARLSQQRKELRKDLIEGEDSLDQMKMMMFVKQSLVEQLHTRLEDLESGNKSLVDAKAEADVTMSQLRAENSRLRRDLDTKNQELEAQAALMSQNNHIPRNLEATNKSVSEAKTNDEMIMLKRRLSTLDSELKRRNDELHLEKSLNSSKDEEIQRLEAFNAGFLKAQEEAQFDQLSLQADLESANKRLQAFETEHEVHGRGPMIPDKELSPLGNPSTSSVRPSIDLTASRPLRTTNATITLSESVAFTVSLQDATLLNFSSDVLPVDVLHTLRTKFRIWKADSKNSWAIVQSSKKTRSCIITRLEKEKSHWNDGHEYACAMCEQRMRLCIVVDSAERILLLPRKVAEDEGRGPTDTKYWTR